MMKWIFALLLILILLGLELRAEACDAMQIGKCQERMTREVMEVQDDDKKQVCVLLDKMRDCMIKEAGCPEESMKEAFELIMPGLREKFDIRCDGCGTRASLGLLSLLAFYLLMIHK